LEKLRFSQTHHLSYDPIWSSATSIRDSDGRPDQSLLWRGQGDVVRRIIGICDPVDTNRGFVVQQIPDKQGERIFVIFNTDTEIQLTATGDIGDIRLGSEYLSRVEV